MKTYKNIRKVFGDLAVSRVTTFRWIGLFTSGKGFVNDLAREGITTSKAFENIARVERVLKNNLKINFFKKYAFISYQYKILSKLKKRIEFCGYFTHGLVLQRKIKAWSLLALGRVYLKCRGSVQRRQSFGSTLLFFFVEPNHG